MRFINTDGLSFLGPGSEWFWTALSGIVLAVTFLAIYRQLRLQGSAAARGQLNEVSQEWGSERMLRMRLAACQSLLDGTLDDASVTWDTCNFWESVGTLAREGHLNMRVMKTLLGANVTWWWTLMGPEYARVRNENAAPELWEDFEWLASQMFRLETGTVAVSARPVTAEVLQARISRLQQRIALEESLRSVRAAI